MTAPTIDCPTCGGQGEIFDHKHDDYIALHYHTICPRCYGRGQIIDPQWLDERYGFVSRKVKTMPTSEIMQAIKNLK